MKLLATINSNPEKYFVEIWESTKFYIYILKIAIGSPISYIAIIIQNISKTLKALVVR